MHFTVLVAGADPDKQMQPFNESLESVIEAEQTAFRLRKQQDPNASSDPIYLKRVDVLDIRRREFEADLAAGKNHEDNLYAYVYEYYYGEIKFIPKSVYLKKPEICAWEHKRGGFGNVPEITEWLWSLEYGNRFAVLGDNGELEAVVVYAVDQPKWDWYEIGGRWKNFFKIKPDAVARVRYENASIINERHARNDWLNRTIPLIGSLREPDQEKLGYSDQAVKGDIDFEGMREDARQKGLKEWHDFHAIVNGRPFRTYDEVLAECDGDHAKARAVQEADPVDQAIRKTDFIWCDVDDLKRFRWPAEEYAQFCADRAIVPYALLHNGVWEERETWQSSTPWERGQWVKRDMAEWIRKVNATVDALPDDTLLTLIDYHT